MASATRPGRPRRALDAYSCPIRRGSHATRGLRHLGAVQVAAAGPGGGLEGAPGGGDGDVEGLEPAAAQLAPLDRDLLTALTRRLAGARLEAPGEPQRGSAPDRAPAGLHPQLPLDTRANLRRGGVGRGSRTGPARGATASATRIDRAPAT